MGLESGVGLGLGSLFRLEFCLGLNSGVWQFVQSLSRHWGEFGSRDRWAAVEAQLEWL